MAITTEAVNVFNRYFGAVANKYSLGTLLRLGTPKFAGKHTTTGDASDPYQNTVTLTGLLTTDIVVATVQTPGATPVSLMSATPTANTLTLRFSADPSTDHVVSYVVYPGV